MRNGDRRGAPDTKTVQPTGGADAHRSKASRDPSAKPEGENRTEALNDHQTLAEVGNRVHLGERMINRKPESRAQQHEQNLQRKRRT